MDDEKDRFGDFVSLLERARQDVYIEQMKVSQRERMKIRICFEQRSFISSSVSIIFAKPCRLKNPVSTGTITSSQARSALKVMRPTEGGQSTIAQ